MPQREPATEEEWRTLLLGDWAPLHMLRRRFRRLPSEPRCKLCSAPFGGIGGRIAPLFGFGRWEGNQALCRACFSQLDGNGAGGAEVPVSLLFADIRGSTGLAERLGPSAFKRVLDSFYRLSSQAVLDNGGLVDKFVGDEIVALFLPAIAGANHAAPAIAAARVLLGAVGADHASPSGPIPVGVAVHSGESYVGIVGQAGKAWDFTALGDPVNTTARLASEARAGELLVSVAAATAAGLPLDGRERRSVDVRGRSMPIDVVSLSSAVPVEAAPEAVQA
jgi:adenylate cyclase